MRPSLPVRLIAAMPFGRRNLLRLTLLSEVAETQTDILFIRQAA